MGNSESQAINFTVVDRWQDVDEVLNHAAPGDLIEFRRTMGLYGHWAVYIGDGEVVNYGRKNPIELL
jgi:cell wall-associated NlpC family hydrolase